MLPFGNAPVHNGEGVRENVASCGFRRMAHPPHIPDLVPCDCFRFGAMKQAFVGHHFATIHTFLMSVEAFQRGLSADFLQTIFQESIR
jgi:hypothetical protein